MCGRFVLKHAPRQVANLFQLADLPDFLQPRYNIAPSQPVAVVGLKPDGKTRGLAMLSWGLLPDWSQSAKDGFPNARAETVHRLLSFRSSFESKRCLIPASGFYEWKKLGAKAKQPYHIRLTGDRLCAFAGLWQFWTDGAQKLTTCCLITTMANELMQPIHDRMPVILRPEDYGEWIGHETPSSRLRDLLKPFDSREMEAYPAGFTHDNG